VDMDYGYGHPRSLLFNIITKYKSHTLHTSSRLSGYSTRCGVKYVSSVNLLPIVNYVYSSFLKYEEETYKSKKSQNKYKNKMLHVYMKNILNVQYAIRICICQMHQLSVNWFDSSPDI
jgi:hypothetical protein